MIRKSLRVFLQDKEFYRTNTNLVNSVIYKSACDLSSLINGDTGVCKVSRYYRPFLVGKELSTEYDLRQSNIVTKPTETRTNMQSYGCSGSSTSNTT